MVPEWWPRPRLTVLLSGGLEILLGILLIIPATRGPAGALSAGLFVAYAGVHADDLRHVGAARRFQDTTVGVTSRALANLFYAAAAVYVAMQASPVP